MMNYSKDPLSLSTWLKLATEMLANYPQRPWGKASALAKAYGISRQWLYRLRDQAISALTQPFSPKSPAPKPTASTSQKKKQAKLARNRRLIARRRQDKNDARRRKQQLARRDRRRSTWAKMTFRRRSGHHYLGLKMTHNDTTAAQQTALRFKVGASTVRRWAKMYQPSGNRGLLAKIPQQVGRSSQVTQITIAFIVLLRRRLGWGAQRSAADLKSKGIANLSHQTVHRTFRKLNLKTKTYHPKGKSNGIRYRRYRRDAPNQLWHLSFAGPFQMSDSHGYRLVVVLDYSHYALAMEVISCRDTEVVTAGLQKLFFQYGKPKELLTDKGPPVAEVTNRGESPFSRFCQLYPIKPLLTPLYYPEANGKVEALIRSLKRECIRKLELTALTVEELAVQIEPFKNYYNWQRLHKGLGYDVPSAFYCGVRLASSLLAIPEFQEMDLPLCPSPQTPPSIDIEFIHRHTA